MFSQSYRFRSNDGNYDNIFHGCIVNVVLVVLSRFLRVWIKYVVKNVWRYDEEVSVTTLSNIKTSCGTSFEKTNLKQRIPRRHLLCGERNACVQTRYYFISSRFLYIVSFWYLNVLLTSAVFSQTVYYYYYFHYCRIDV